MDEACLFAYFAGAIDADGHITIQRSTRKVGVRYIHQPTYYSSRVGFTGTADPKVQTLLKKHFGGSLFTHQPKNPKYKPLCVWTAEGNQASLTLRAIMPYLISKTQQAVLALELIDLKTVQWAEIKRTQKPPYRITDEMTSSRHAIWEACTRLNAPRNRTVHFLDKGEGELSMSE